MVETAKNPNLTDSATFVIEQIRLLGQEPTPGSRLMRMHDILQRVHIPYHDPDFPIALNAHRDIAEIAFIFEQLQSHRENEQFRGLVKRLLEDSCLPEDDRINSQGRDSQFELYIAATCKKAAMTPVTYDEPDVTCNVDGSILSIAAKRIKNVRQAGGRVNKAIEQIKRAGHPGVIALDLSIAWNRNNTPVISQLQSQCHGLIFDIQTNKFFKRHHQAIEMKCMDAGVLGAVLFYFSVHVEDGKWKQRRCASLYEIDRNHEPTSLFNRFVGLFTSVMTIPERLAIE